MISVVVFGRPEHGEERVAEEIGEKIEGSKTKRKTKVRIYSLAVPWLRLGAHGQP